MRFLTKDETKLLEKKLRLQIADKPRPKLVLYSKSGDHAYRKSATAITAAIGDFQEATLLFLFCLAGNGWRAPCTARRLATVPSLAKQEW